MFATAVTLSGLTAIGQVGAPAALPQPSGGFGVGRIAYDWVDAKRPDPFSPAAQSHREVIVYVWYPTASDQKTDTGVYQPDATRIDATQAVTRLRQSPIWPAIASGAVKSHARDNAPIAVTPPTFPVVLFSHGDTDTNTFGHTTLIEDLVSHGYIVAAVEHPYSSAAVVFPDGRVIFGDTRQRFRGDRPTGFPYFEGVQIAMKDMRQMADIEAADLRFVVDQIARVVNADRSSPLFHRLDLQRIAAVGHSLGGMAAVRACQLDTRIKACVNQDGGTPDGLFLRFDDAKPLRQPFLFVDASPTPSFTDDQLAQRGITRAEWDRNAETVTETQQRQLRQGAGGSYRVQVRAPGMNHGSFGDAVLLAITPEARQHALHNTELTVNVTRAFLDKTLKGERSTLLDHGSTNAELKIEAFSARK